MVLIGETMSKEHHDSLVKWLEEQRLRANALQEKPIVQGPWPVIAAPKMQFEMPANDDGPPCINLKCTCGELTHICQPQWSDNGDGTETPVIRCERCEAEWLLGGWVMLTAENKKG